MIVKTREMGMTHRDFFRTFPAVARGTQWRQDGDMVMLGNPEKQDLSAFAFPTLLKAAIEQGQSSLRHDQVLH